MNDFNISQLLGLQVTAGKPVNVYLSIFEEPILSVPTGSPLGTLFSYVVRDNVLWWMIDNSTYGTYYVKDSPGVFNEVDLMAQGAQTNEQLIEQLQEEESGFFDNLIGGGGDFLKIGGLLIIGVLAVKLLSK